MAAILWLGLLLASHLLVSQKNMKLDLVHGVYRSIGASETQTSAFEILLI